MNENLKTNIYGMKDIPDILIYCPFNKWHLTIGHVQYCSHKIVHESSEIQFTTGLINKEFLKNINLLLKKDSCSLFLKNSIRSLLTGEDEDYYWKIDKAQLKDYRFGMAINGDPSNFTFVFQGKSLEIGNLGLDKYYYELLEKEGKQLYV